MGHIKRFDHVGITVADLDRAVEFFVALGLDVDARWTMEGEFVDAVTGIEDARTEVVGLRAPGGGTWIELSTFFHPDPVPGPPNAMANDVGLRNVAFEVHDLQAAVDQLAADGYPLIGRIGEHQNTWQMAYVRGPEGIVVALAQRVG